MKIILFSLLVLSGAVAKAQHQNSQVSQVISMRLQPVSFIDMSSPGISRQLKDIRNNEEVASTLHDIIVNRNTLQAAPSTSAYALLQHEEKNSSKEAPAISFNETQPVYTFSSR